MACKDCVHYEVCMLVDRSDGAENEPCDRFTAFDNCEAVVRCHDCDLSAYPEAKIVWCKRHNKYMPVNGYCNYGARKGDV